MYVHHEEYVACGTWPTSRSTSLKALSIFSAHNQGLRCFPGPWVLVKDTILWALSNTFSLKLSKPALAWDSLNTTAWTCKQFYSLQSHRLGIHSNCQPSQLTWELWTCLIKKKRNNMQTIWKKKMACLLKRQPIPHKRNHLDKIQHAKLKQRYRNVFRGWGIQIRHQ